MKSPALASSALILVLAAGLAGCAVKKSITGPEPTRFLTSTGTDTTTTIERLPFKHAWRDPKMVIANYKYIVVRPVTTAFLDTAAWEESKSAFVPDQRTYQKRCTALARYWTRSLDKSFSSPVCVFYKTTDTRRPGTLILEVALTEVRFDPAGAAPQSGTTPAGNASSLFSGLPMCGFEVRVTDAATGKVVTTASDRRGPEIKILDPDGKSTTTARPNEKICDEWSNQLMESANIDLFPKVRRSWFSIF